jgi:hypothetical protein
MVRGLVEYWLFANHKNVEKIFGAFGNVYITFF